MAEVSVTGINEYSNELKGIANKLKDALSQVEADINELSAAVATLESYNGQDASAVMTETIKNNNGLLGSIGSIIGWAKDTVRVYKYVWDINVTNGDMTNSLAIVKDAVSNAETLDLSGDDLANFAIMLNDFISLIEKEILIDSQYDRKSFNEYSSLSDLFSTLKKNDTTGIWQEYKDTYKYSKELKKKDLLYNKYRTQEGEDDYVDFLLDEMGNHRISTDDRNTKYGIWYNNKYGVMSKNDAFCAAGVSYTLEHTATTGILNPYIGVSAGAADAKAKAKQGIGTWHYASDTSYQPKRGDIFYKGGDHTGIILDSDEKYIYTIEANTASDEGVSGYVNTRIRERSGNAPYITEGGYYSPPVEFSNANDSSITLDTDYINKKLGIQNGGNE